MTSPSSPLSKAPRPEIAIIGFGSQARAWAHCLRKSGWSVQIFLTRPQGASGEAARNAGFSPHPLPEVGDWAQTQPKPAAVAFLCPDHVIGSVYQETLAAITGELTLILAHGYAVYAGDLRPTNPQHVITLLAPKAIGPKISAHFDQAQAAGEPYHRLVAGFSAPPERSTQLQNIAEAMGFAPQRLARATFEQEAIGDLLSEQGLLCGGVFTLLEWTIEAMQKAGIPPALIHEECLTELELIAGMLRERGPSATFGAISHAAQAGALEMNQAIQGVRPAFDRQLGEVLNGGFIRRFRSGEWRAGAARWKTKFAELEASLQSEKSPEKPL